jgi:hypothetical protein
VRGLGGNHLAGALFDDRVPSSRADRSVASMPLIALTTAAAPLAGFASAPAGIASDAQAKAAQITEGRSRSSPPRPTPTDRAGTITL